MNAKNASFLVWKIIVKQKKNSCSDLLLFLLPPKIAIWITNTIHQWTGYSQRVLIFVSPKLQRQRHFRMHMHCSGVWTGFSRTAENKTLKISYWFTSLWFSFARKESSRSLDSCNLSAAEEQPPHLGTTFPRLPDSSNLNICPWGEAVYLQQLMSAHSRRKLHALPKLLQWHRGASEWLSASIHPQPKRNATHAEVSVTGGHFRGPLQTHSGNFGGFWGQKSNSFLIKQQLNSTSEQALCVWER